MDDNFTQIKDLGVNFIVHRINTTNLPLIQEAGLKVIANNWNYAEDFIFDFSTAMRTIYKPRPEWFDSYTEEIRFNKGHEITIGGNSVWLIDTIEEPGDAVSQGPNVAQYDRYINRFRKNDTIPYILNWRLKIDPEPNLPDEPVCKLSVLYITEDTTILIADTILSASSFSDEFENHSLRYTLEELIGLAYLVQSNTDGPEYHSTPEDIEALTFKGGINYQLDYYGSRNLYIESIECYDEKIWQTYMIINPELFTDELISQTSELNNPIVFSWFVYDEPHSIDLYSPLKVLYDKLPDNSVSPPINALYPEWDGIRNENPTIKQFIDSVAPTNFMFYYLPFWQTSVPEEYNNAGISVLWHLNNRLKEAHSHFPGFWHAVQSMSFINEAGNDYQWRKPAFEELTAQIHLALANGSKGIVLSNYYTYPRLEYYDPDDATKHVPLPRSEGLVYVLEGDEENWQTTVLYDKLKLYFKPRIQGLYGDLLYKLTYTGQYISKAFIDRYEPFIEADSSIENNKRLSLIAMNNSPYSHHSHHIGFFDDSTDIVNHRYFLLVNAYPKHSSAADDTINISFLPPDTATFKNFRYRNVEGGLDTNFSGIYSGAVSIHGGDGKLFQIVPTLRYGGLLTTNDEVKNTETLFENLRISLGDTLKISGNYFLNANLQVDSGAGLVQTGYTYIDSTGSFSVSKWSNSLLKSREGSRPKLVWADYPGTDSVLTFTIYRKKQDTVFSFLATVNSSVRSFIDSSTSILEGTPIMNETFADYYVTVTVLLPGGRNQTASYNSNTINYNRVRGTAAEKKGEDKEITKPYSYSLEQNYPNPFNPETVISYSIKKQGMTTLRIFDINGRMVGELVNKVLEPGKYTITFKPEKNLSSGVYLIELVSGEYRSVQKAMLLK